MANIAFYRDFPAIAPRSTENAADWGSGMNNSSGGCIGIGIDQGALSGDPQQFTLLDQRGDARTPQKMAVIGGVGYVPRDTDWPTSGGLPGTGDDQPIKAGETDDQGDIIGGSAAAKDAWLQDLANGWVEDPTP